jgi:hypothetical protein
LHVPKQEQVSLDKSEAQQHKPKQQNRSVERVSVSNAERHNLIDKEITGILFKTSVRLLLGTRERKLL